MFAIGPNLPKPRLLFLQFILPSGHWLIEIEPNDHVTSALVDAVEHLRARRRVLHALGRERSLPGVTLVEAPAA
jgi:hypothetical protein